MWKKSWWQKKLSRNRIFICILSFPEILKGIHWQTRKLQLFTKGVFFSATNLDLPWKSVLSLARPFSCASIRPTDHQRVIKNCPVMVGRSVYRLLSSSRSRNSRSGLFSCLRITLKIRSHKYESLPYDKIILGNPQIFSWPDDLESHGECQTTRNNLSYRAVETPVV